MRTDFSFISESDDSAVDDIISQAIDQCVLEQVVSINSSGFSDSLLPTDLDTRFTKLKSFPPGRRPVHDHHPTHQYPPPCLKKQKEGSSSSTSLDQFENTHTSSSPIDETGSSPPIFNRSKTTPGIDKSDSKQKPTTEFIHSPSSSSPIEETGLSPTSNRAKTSSGIDKSSSKQKPRTGFIRSPSSSSPIEETGLSPISNRAKTSLGIDRSGSKQKPRTGFIRSSSSSSDSTLEISSPPRQGCCFCYSPKKKRVSRKKRKETRVSGIGLDPLDDDEFLTDLTMLSMKEQKRKLKRVVKEQERINREAEKIVEWAKQASARIEVSEIEDLWSDDDDHDEKFK